MKCKMVISGLLILLGLTWAAVAQAEPAGSDDSAAKLRVGVFDSRAVALAYYRSAAHMDQIREMKREHAEAKKNGDEERAEELSQKGQRSQHLAHLQGFGTYRIDDLLERIKDGIPGIAEEAGVDIIVSKWDLVHSAPAVELVDVTLQMVKPFDPSPETLKMIAEELPKVDPVPLEELEKHDH